MLSEQEVLKFWDDINAFETSLKLSENRPLFTFFEGPPFSTGSPHYGHFVTSTMKDIVCRHRTMRGYHVPRRFGFDCHGLPIEFKIDQKLGIKTTQQVLDLGIDKYNEACRGIVMQCADDWKKFIKRIGRWIDMDNDYKTMDTTYMESVWWVLSELSKKGLVYRGYKVSPYSTACGTPLSNFEVKDSYKTVTDWSITVQFTLRPCVQLTQLLAFAFSQTRSSYAISNWLEAEQYIRDYGVQILVWTTTPWTLPSNLMLCIRDDLEYHLFRFKIYDEYGSVYIVAKCRFETVTAGRDTVILGTVKGSSLVGLSYVPVFGYYSDRADATTTNAGFRVITDSFVESGSGTGVVHCAPAFGAEDYKACLDAGVITRTELPLCPIDDHGLYVEPVNEWLGQNVKDAESAIVEHLFKKGHLFAKGKIDHPYPFCWRSNTPLIYKVCESWFINAESIRDALIQSNAATTWVPSHIRDNRFGKWISGATDWCISRNRFWGTPMPIWTNKNQTETVFVTSREDLAKRAGISPHSIKDLHRDHVDDITIPSATPGGEPLRRVPYVCDTWLDSGCMPYAYIGYPESGAKLNFADFISEGLDQTRGWFYTLTVIATALNGQSPFKNVMVNGIVLNEHGEKMAKSLNNYPPVDAVLDKYGADALRLYLINTPVVKGGDIRFKDTDIEIVVKKYCLMLKNVVKFYLEMVALHNSHTGTDNGSDSGTDNGSDSGSGAVSIPFFIKSLADLNLEKNILDQWIVGCLKDLCEYMGERLDNYKLFGITDRLFKFIDQLSRWYMNLNKTRFKRGLSGKHRESPECLSVLGNCLYYFAALSAPVAPFMSESIFTALRPTLPGSIISRGQSIHFHPFPTSAAFPPSRLSLKSAFDHFAELIDMTRLIRAQRKHIGKSATSVKLAIPKMHIASADVSVLNELLAIEAYLTSELNVSTIEYCENVEQFASFTMKPNIAVIKQRVTDPKKLGAVLRHFKTLTPDQIQNVIANKSCVYDEDDVVVAYSHELIIESIPKPLLPLVVLISPSNLVVAYDTTVTTNILEEYYVKLFYRGYQDSRKRAGLSQTDHVRLEYGCSDYFEDLLRRYSTIGVAPDANRVLPRVVPPQESRNLVYAGTLDVEVETVKLCLFKMQTQNIASKSQVSV